MKTKFTCSATPETDYLEITDCFETVDVLIEEQGARAQVALSPKDARKLGLNLIRVAEQATNDD